MRIDILHNVTPGERGSFSLAIFDRSGPNVTAPGDTMQYVGSLPFEDAADEAGVYAALNHAFEAGNSPYETDATRAYRSWEVRSLSKGDAVILRHPDGTSAGYVVCSRGWELVADLEGVFDVQGLPAA